MSEIKTDKLTGTSTAGSILVTGEGNSTTTNLQQGLAKHWVRFDQVNSNTFGDTFNSSSFTDVGTGNTKFTRTSNLANDDYAAFITAEVQADYANVSNSLIAGATQLSTSFMSAYHVEAGSAQDTRTITEVAFGDLA